MTLLIHLPDVPPRCSLLNIVDLLTQAGLQERGQRSMLAIGLSSLPAHLDLCGDSPKRFLCESLLCSIVVWKGSWLLFIRISIAFLCRASVAPLTAYKHPSKSLSVMLLVMILIHGSIASLLTRTIPARIDLHKHTIYSNYIIIIFMHYLLSLLAWPCLAAITDDPKRRI